MIKLAEKIADMYASKIQPEGYHQLCNAIAACKEYHLGNKDDWNDLAMLVLGEDGIWINAHEPQYSEEIQDMWALETNILICNCYLACMDEGDYLPQDMELQGDKIPEFDISLEFGMYVIAPYTPEGNPCIETMVEELNKKFSDK